MSSKKEDVGRIRKSAERLLRMPEDWLTNELSDQEASEYAELMEQAVKKAAGRNFDRLKEVVG